MGLDPELERLGAELAHAGHTVVPHGDHLCVRLSFFVSLRIRLQDGALRLEHRFGTASRDWSVISSIALLSTATAVWYAVLGPHPVPLAFAFITVLSTVFDAMRVVISEGTATRVQTAWSTLRRSVAAPHERMHALSTPTSLALPEARPLATAGERIATPQELVRTRTP